MREDPSCEIMANNLVGIKGLKSKLTTLLQQYHYAQSNDSDIIMKIN